MHNSLHASLQALADLKSGASLRLAGWIGASQALILSRLILEQKKTLVLVAPNLKQALLWQQDLRFFLKDKAPVYLFPSLDVLPYFHLSPNPDVIMDRLGLLWKLNYLKTPSIVIVPLAALIRKLIPRDVFKKNSFSLARGDSINHEELAQKLTHLSFQRTPLVEDQGGFAIRGGLIDVYSSVHDLPARIDLFGDSIESIRLYDPKTQKTIQTVDQYHIIPAREILFLELEKKFSGKLKKLCDENEIPKSERDIVNESLDQKIYFNGIESYLPFFYKSPSTLFDYFPNESLICFADQEALEIELDQFLQELEQKKGASTSLERLFSPSEIFLTKKELAECLTYFPQINFSELQKPDQKIWQVQMESNLALQNKIRPQIYKEEALRPLASELNDQRMAGNSIFIVASNLAQKERLVDLLKRYNLPVGEGDSFIKVIEGPISQGFYWPEEKQWWIADEEIFGKKVHRKTSKPVGEAFLSFSDLSEGDYVVHQDHGIALYKGLKNLTISHIKNDFLLLEYQGHDKLYVPVDQLNRISRYSSQEGIIPHLDKMGGTSWKKVRENVKKAARKLARQLLEIQAARNSMIGFTYSPRNELFEEFEAGFPFDETQDQLKAIDDVLGDMENPKPMDRLVCGDVGYGKTEVAMRAAFKAVLDHKQVAVLVPTTVLAFQHFASFKKRFENHAVQIACLSRLQTTKEQKEILDKITKGEIDLLIATHRLLSSDIQFRDLGLLIIDEEHRFGVAQKEKIKKLKNLVDVLALSATPIPRTLNFALSGIRDLSLINTPPADRLAIRTYTAQFDEGLIREAILREIGRGGQIYFVHNRVQSIGAMKERLQKIVPKIAIEIAHGQMPEKDLEQTMLDFMQQKFQVLLCSTIIESGLDIPNANTMIINRADHMGLAQLYQLRGRVGRSHHRAYCYLMIPHDSLITDVAKKRLAVIQKFTELGSGFKIASHDLEIRGAGNILGDEQSGHIEAIGYDLYIKLLEEAVLALQGKIMEEEIECEIKLPIAASIPEDLVPDTQLRLVLYKQVSSLKQEEECPLLREEWMDRFGKLPWQTENLIELIRLKIKARQLKITSITCQKDSYTYQIHPQSQIPLDYFLNKVKKQPKKYRVLPDGKFVIYDMAKSDKELIDIVQNHLEDMR